MYISLSVFYLTYNKPSVLLFSKNLFIWSFLWKQNKHATIFPKQLICVHDEEHECKYSVFYVLKSYLCQILIQNFSGP